MRVPPARDEDATVRRLPGSGPLQRGDTSKRRLAPGRALPGPPASSEPTLASAENQGAGEVDHRVGISLPASPAPSAPCAAVTAEEQAQKAQRWRLRQGMRERSVEFGGMGAAERIQREDWMSGNPPRDQGMSGTYQRRAIREVRAAIVRGVQDLSPENGRQLEEITELAGRHAEPVLEGDEGGAGYGGIDSDRAGIIGRAECQGVMIGLCHAHTPSEVGRPALGLQTEAGDAGCASLVATSVAQARRSRVTGGTARDGTSARWNW